MMTEVKILVSVNIVPVMGIESVKDFISDYNHFSRFFFSFHPKEKNTGIICRNIDDEENYETSINNIIFLN